MEEKGICPSCGQFAPLQNGTCIYCMQREASINMINTFRKEMSNVTNAFQFIQNAPQQIDQQRRILQSTNSGGIIIILMIIGVLVTLVLFSGLDAALNNTSSEMVVIMFLVILIVGVILFVNIIISAGKSQETAKNQISYLESEFQRALNDIARAWRNSNKILPIKYCAPELSYDIQSILVNRRASTIQEAINVYEDDLYKNNMLRSQQEIYSKTQMIADLNKISAIANTVTAYNTFRRT